MHAEYPQQIFSLEDSFAHGNFVLIMEMRKIAPNDGGCPLKKKKKRTFFIRDIVRDCVRLSNNLRAFISLRFSLFYNFK